MKVRNKNVIVIGAGLGGMSAALSLAAEGFTVSIFEKNDRVGGKLNLLQKDGFSFDLGPSIFTLPQYFRSLFDRCGKNLDDYIELVPVTPHWRNFFPDGVVIDLYNDPKKMHAEVAKLPGDSKKLWAEVQRFLAYSKQQYDIVAQGYFDRGLDNLWEFIRFYGLFRLGTKMDHRHKMSEMIQSMISEPHLRAIFEYFIKYVGSSALNAPGFMNLMPNIQFEFGLWYVQGGMYNLAKACEKLLYEMNVNIHLNTQISDVIHDQGRIRGIRLLNGSTFRADYVVSNMEAYPFYQKVMHENDSFLKKQEKFEPTCSGIVLHLGTDRIYDQLAHHNFFFSADQKKHFELVFDEKKLPEDPTIYVVAPTRTDRSQAPTGHDNIKILPHIPYINQKHPYTREDYIDFKELVLTKLEKMGLTDLRKHIVVEDFWTPLDIESKYFSNHGSIYGVVSDWKKNHGFKFPKKSKKYTNLYFVGGSVNPGGGMPMVVLCGQKVCDRIVDQEHRSHG